MRFETSLKCYYLPVVLLGTCLLPAANAQSILAGGTVNSADYSRSFAPGAIISIFGNNLATSTIVAPSLPLPTSLSGTSVQVLSTGEQMPLFFVSAGQINAQLPYDVPLGQIQVIVTTASGVSNSDTIVVAGQAPKFFTLDFSGTGPVVATTTSYQVLTAAAPTKPADSIILWMNSLGATKGSPVAGQPAPGADPGSTPLSLLTTPTVTINGQAAKVIFAGLTPTLSGLYQINVQAPFVQLTGPVAIQVTVGSATTQANVTIPFQQTGFYYSLLGGKPVTGQTLNGVSGSTSALALRQSDAITWGPNGFGAWTDNTGLGSAYSTATGLALTLRNGTSVVYDNNGIETGSVGAFYNNVGGPPNNQKPGLSDLYSMSNYFPLIFAGDFKIAQATTITELIGYFDPGGSQTLPFDPANPYFKFRMNIFSLVAGPLPKETGSFVGDLFSTDTTAGTFSYSDTGVLIVSNLSTDAPKHIFRLSYKLNTPLTLSAGEYWFSHDASIRATPGSSSTASAISVEALGKLIGAQKVDQKSIKFNLLGRDMFMDNSWVLPEAFSVRPSTPIQQH